jgi:hypothetical protein
MERTLDPDTTLVVTMSCESRGTTRTGIVAFYMGKKNGRCIVAPEAHMVNYIHRGQPLYEVVSALKEFVQTYYEAYGRMPTTADLPVPGVLPPAR